MTAKKAPHMGKLPPKYTFILNPYANARFTRCPGCDQPTRVRKLPLFIHVDPLNPIVLGKTCRYCPDCDLSFVHQDELEAQLAAMFEERDPSLTGNDYLVQDPARRLPREEVVPQVRYRVAQQGWHRVAESAVEYDASPAPDKSRPFPIRSHDNTET